MSRVAERLLLEEWFVPIDSNICPPTYNGREPTDLVRLIRNIFEHFDEGFNLTTYNRRSAAARGLFAAPAEYTRPNGEIDKTKYLQAVADWFCCTYPELIDLLWDGLVENPDLGF